MAVEGKAMYDEIFVADHNDYNYEKIKFKEKQKKKFDAFNIDNLEVEDGAKKQVRSESALSDSDDDADDKKDPIPSKKGAQKEAEDKKKKEAELKKKKEQEELKKKKQAEEDKKKKDSQGKSGGDENFMGKAKKWLGFF